MFNNWDDYEKGLKHIGVTAAGGMMSYGQGLAKRKGMGLLKSFKKTSVTQNLRRGDQSRAINKNTKNNVSDNISKSMSSGAHEDDEVAVVPIPKRISKILPDYATIKLPLSGYDYFIPGTTTTTGDTPQKKYLILNQIVNPYNGQTVDPRGITKYQSIYDFYRVIETHVKVEFYLENATQDEVALIGWQLSDDSTAGAGWSTQRDFMESKHGGSFHIYPSTQNGDKHVFQYSFRPENWDIHVSQTDDSVRWTAVNDAVSPPRYLVMGVVNALVPGQATSVVKVHLRS